jgi:hypothetical protein
MEEKIIDINESYIRTFIQQLRPEDLEIRRKIDYEYRFDGKNFELLEVRPFWDNPQEIMKNAFAKITYVKSKKSWKLYWMRASGKWELYEPLPMSTNIQEFLETIKTDGFGCFFS